MPRDGADGDLVRHGCYNLIITKFNLMRVSYPQQNILLQCAAVAATLLLTPALALAQPLTLSCPSPANGATCLIGNMQWNVESAGQPWSVANVDPTTLRFELRQNDSRPGEYSNSVQRVEVNSGQQYRFPGGRPFTTQFDLNVLPGSVSTAWFLTLYQLAYPFQGVGVWNGSPDVELGLRPGDHLSLIAQRGCPNNQNQINWPNGLWTDPNPVVRGTAHTFKITMFFDANDGNGQVQAWRDDVRIANYSGVLGCPATRDHFQSFGIYRDRVPETLATTLGNLYYGNVGTTSAPSPTVTFGHD
jgi:hypothetical protein